MPAYIEAFSSQLRPPRVRRSAATAAAHAAMSAFAKRRCPQVCRRAAASGNRKETLPKCSIVASMPRWSRWILRPSFYANDVSLAPKLLATPGQRRRPTSRSLYHLAFFMVASSPVRVFLPEKPLLAVTNNTMLCCTERRALPRRGRCAPPACSAKLELL